jgi:hypothetical protein
VRDFYLLKVYLFVFHDTTIFYLPRLLVFSLSVIISTYILHNESSHHPLIVTPVLFLISPTSQKKGKRNLGNRFPVSSSVMYVDTYPNLQISRHKNFMTQITPNRVSLVEKKHQLRDSHQNGPSYGSSVDLPPPPLSVYVIS